MKVLYGNFEYGTIQLLQRVLLHVLRESYFQYLGLWVERQGRGWLLVSSRLSRYTEMNIW